MTCIFNIIIWIKQYKALKTPKDDTETFKVRAVSHFLYIISLISACNDIFHSSSISISTNGKWGNDLRINRKIFCFKCSYNNSINFNFQIFIFRH